MDMAQFLAGVWVVVMASSHCCYVRAKLRRNLCCSMVLSFRLLDGVSNCFIRRVPLARTLPGIKPGQAKI